MRRSALVTLTTLGILVSLIGSTGIFAALTDSARTGTNQVDSEGLAASADIELAVATQDSGTGAITCGTFSDDVSSALFTLSDVGPTGVLQKAFFCIRNVGSQTVTVSAMVDELVDTDTACTGDEELHGDTTCGNGLAGELSSQLIVGYAALGCDGTHLSGGEANLNSNATTPFEFPDGRGDLATGTVGCFSVELSYPTTVPSVLVQQAQSDRAEWRFEFIADA